MFTLFRELYSWRSHSREVSPTRKNNRSFLFWAYLNHSLYSRSSNHGNFLEILRWAATTDPIVRSIFEDSAGNANYLSHEVQNELINVMADKVREKSSSMVNWDSRSLSPLPLTSFHSFSVGWPFFICADGWRVSRHQWPSTTLDCYSIFSLRR